MSAILYVVFGPERVCLNTNGISIGRFCRAYGRDRHTRRHKHTVLFIWTCVKSSSTSVCNQAD